MKDLIKKLLDSGRKDALDSLDKLTEAAGELGYTSEQIEEALDGFNGFPLDDDDLGMVAGGMGEAHRAGINSYGTEMAQVVQQQDFSQMSNMTQFSFPGSNQLVNPNQGFDANQGGNDSLFGISRL